MRLSNITALFMAIAFCAASMAQTQQPTGNAARRIGAVKAINGTQLTLTPDSGPDIAVTIQGTTRILRVAPGEKDLKNAAPISLQEVQVGDRILIGGKISDDGAALAASTVVVMKHSDVEARREHELQDWQKRGVDGSATAVDAAAGTVTISAGSFGAKKIIVIHASSATVIRRYAPDSSKFDDAKPSTLGELHPGDQVRARGNRSADGSDVTAEEIVFGSFHNIAGTVNSADAASSTLTVHDLLSNKTVTVKINADSQLRNLPPEMAQRIAARFKAAVMGTAPGAGSSPSDNSAQHTATPAGVASNGNGATRSGAPDIQRFLSRAPAVSLGDLHKGDAVVVLTTEGSAGQGTVITLLTGVEPILRAAPGAGGASILTPWSLSVPAGDAGGP